MNVLVSACLLGVSCRYDGRSKGHPLAGELLKKHTAIPVCPEILGGLSTPRVPSERRGSGVVTKDGADVTEQVTQSSSRRSSMKILSFMLFRSS